jgi:hypothetical protein
MEDLMRIISNIDFAGTAAVVGTTLSVIISIVIYGCKAISLYLLSAKTKQKHTWMSFIPVLQDIKVFSMAGLSVKAFIVFYALYRALLSAKLELGIFLPLAYIGIAIYYAGLFYARYQMAKNFGCKQAICILNAIFEPFVLIYIASQPFNHQYTSQHPKVDFYLKTYNLYEDPRSFIDPKATGKSIFDKAPVPPTQQPQNDFEQNNNWYQQAPPNPNMNYQMPPQGPSNININPEKESGNGINIDTNK